MSPQYTLFSRCRPLLFTGVLVVWAGLAFAQAPVEAGQSGLQWKDKATMQLVVQQEITATNTELAKPNLTDWSTAMLEAYKSFLTFTQPKMAASSDMSVLLNQAYDWIKTEAVQNVPARQMVLDDMKAKQQELILKLTFN